MARKTATDLVILEQLTEPAGKDVVDIGCGTGALVRELSARGARVTGVEISDGQLERARAHPEAGQGRYLVGRAEQMPLDAEAVDVAVFMRALHHVPVAHHRAALGECRRILRPGGVLYVAEPLPEGDFFTLTSLVEDEREARAAAQRTLDQAGEFGLGRARTVDYEVEAEIPSVEALRRRIVGVDPERAPLFAQRADEIALAFAGLGEPVAGGGRRFRQPMRADLFARGDG
ncbi:MAG TPA: class I SAM-dependent methyltransferase [Solirubrobacteraceae bacterium]